MQGSHTLVRTPRDEGIPTRVEMNLEVVSDYLHVGQGRVVMPRKEVENPGQIIEAFLMGDTRVYSVVDDLFLEFNAFPRVGDRVVIPGSTIKGAVRTRLEMSVPNSCYIVDRPGVSKSQKYVSIFKPDPNRRSDNYARGIAVNGNRVCPVCDLMGSPGLGSRVSFSDMVMVSGRLGVARVENQDYELALKGSRFSGFFLVNVTRSEIGAILYGLGIRCDAGKVNSRTILLGRFKFQRPEFGRVKFTANMKEQDQCAQINNFVREYRVRDIWEG